MRQTFLLCAGWAVLAGFPAFGDNQQPKEEVRPLALAEVELLIGDWELAVDPKKSPLKAMRATITIKERKTATKPPGVRANIVFHYTTETPAVTQEVDNAPDGGIDFQPVAQGGNRYLQILPTTPVKPGEKLFVAFTLEKDVWTINASSSKTLFFPGGIADLRLPWDKLVWKRVPKKSK